MDSSLVELAQNSSETTIGPKVIPNDPTPQDQAIYILSVSPKFATDIHFGNWKRPLPHGMQNQHLNFLDASNPLFYAPHVMSSAGQALRLNDTGIITQRDRVSTCLLTDSSGFQISQQTGKINDMRDRGAILDWIQNRADMSMTLDIPTANVGKEGYPFNTISACRDRTLDHLRFFEKYHKPGKVTWLNVVQANSHGSGYDWYNAVKKFDFCDGWAIAGKKRKSFTYVLALLLRMMEDGTIQNKKWVHVLGTQELWIAVLLTAVQRGLNANGCNLRISFDTSTACTMIRTNDVFTLPNFSDDDLLLPAKRAPDHKRMFNSTVQWPWPSAIGDRLTLGDINVASWGKSQYCRDNLSNTLMMLHNYASVRETILLANRIMDAQQASREHVIAPKLSKCVGIVRQIFDAGPIKGRETLEHNRTKFNALTARSFYESDRGDED